MMLRFMSLAALLIIGTMFPKVADPLFIPFTPTDEQLFDYLIKGKRNLSYGVIGFAHRFTEKSGVLLEVHTCSKQSTAELWPLAKSASTVCALRKCQRESNLPSECAVKREPFGGMRYPNNEYLPITEYLYLIAHSGGVRGLVSRDSSLTNQEVRKDVSKSSTKQQSKHVTGSAGIKIIPSLPAASSGNIGVGGGLSWGSGEQETVGLSVGESEQAIGSVQIEFDENAFGFAFYAGPRDLYVTLSYNAHIEAISRCKKEGGKRCRVTLLESTEEELRREKMSESDLLIAAVNRRSMDDLMLLLGQGFSPIEPGNQGWTAVHQAAYEANNALLSRLLIDFPADHLALAVDLAGNTPLHVASRPECHMNVNEERCVSRDDSLNVVKTLVEAANANVRLLRKANNDGLLPLHLAVLGARPEVVNYLLQSDSFLSLEEQGIIETAMEMALATQMCEGAVIGQLGQRQRQVEGVLKSFDGNKFSRVEDEFDEKKCDSVRFHLPPLSTPFHYVVPLIIER